MSSEESKKEYARGHKTNTREVLRAAMKARGYTNEMLSKALGYSWTSGASMMTSGTRRIRVDTLIAALDALGFDLVVRDRQKSNKENVWNLEIVEGDEE